MGKRFAQHRWQNSADVAKDAALTCTVACAALLLLRGLREDTVVVASRARPVLSCLLVPPCSHSAHAHACWHAFEDAHMHIHSKTSSSNSNSNSSGSSSGSRTACVHICCILARVALPPSPGSEAAQSWLPLAPDLLQGGLFLTAAVRHATLCAA